MLGGLRQSSTGVMYDGLTPRWLRRVPLVNKEPLIRSFTNDCSQCRSHEQSEKEIESGNP